MPSETAVPTTIEELDAAGARGIGARFKLLYPGLYAHILHKVFDGNATAAEEYLGANGVVKKWFAANGLVSMGRYRPRRGGRDRDERLTGKEVVALWMEQGENLTEYAITYPWKFPEGEELVSLVCMSDLHAQSRFFDAPRLQRTINYIAENPTHRWLCAGDVFTNNTKYSVGSVAEQTVGIWEAVDGMTELLRPIADQCVGIAHGNHDARLQVRGDFDFNPVEQLCRNLSVNYLGYAKHIVLKIGRLKYTLFVHHGKGGAATPGGRLNMGVSIMRTVTSDITIVGHLHDEMTLPSIRRGPTGKADDTGHIPVGDHKQQMVQVASFERYGGYPLEKGLPPTRLGSCRIEFSTTKPKDWRILQ